MDARLHPREPSGAMRIVVFLLFGFVAGAVIGLLTPGRGPRTWFESMIVGAAGAMVGGVVASAFGWNEENDRKGYLVSLVVAVAWVGIYRVVRWRYTVRSP